MKKVHVRLAVFFLLTLMIAGLVTAAGGPPADTPVFPPGLDR